MTRRLILGAILATATLAQPLTALGEATDPAAQQIEAFDASLIDAMKLGKAGPERRYQKLEPAITKAFDLPTMARFAVGPTWTTLSSADQAGVGKAFNRMTVATYAHNFDNYSGERFVVDNVETRGPDKLVHTRLISPGSAPVTLVYRMRQAGGAWKVIDVYYNGAVSSLTGQRSEFSSTLKAGGAPALIKKLTTQADGLLKP
jgi:phospholipid transport system substrate-binding protein